MIKTTAGKRGESHEFPASFVGNSLSVPSLPHRTHSAHESFPRQRELGSATAHFTERRIFEACHRQVRSTSRRHVLVARRNRPAPVCKILDFLGSYSSIISTATLRSSASSWAASPPRDSRLIHRSTAVNKDEVSRWARSGCFSPSATGIPETAAGR